MAAMRASLLPAAAVLLLALAACATGPDPSSPGNADAGTDPCHPRVGPDRPQFVVGYGSLMQDESRKRTSPHAGPAYPVELSGYERGWFERGSAIGFTTTYLGVRRDERSRFNAVVYAVQPDELAATDARESSYCRLEVPLASIAPLAPRSPLPGGARLWIYVGDPRRLALPDARHPIVQSYVDLFLSGCLEQEERFHLKGFARGCVATTTGWSEHWVNDRIFPRRPFAWQPRAGDIDRLLASTVPREFASIRLEAGETAAPR